MSGRWGGIGIPPPDIATLEGLKPPLVPVDASRARARPPGLALSPVWGCDIRRPVAIAVPRLRRSVMPRVAGVRESTTSRPVLASPPPMSEGDLQRLITDAATALGWHWVHFRPARTARGWSTPVSGPLGEGWPDLFLAHPRQGRLMAIECKGPKTPVSTSQLGVHAVLVAAGLEVHTVRPSDIDTILEVLR